MESWKEFDQNPITHSVAHHLVAIADLLDEFGYARVSDVARVLGITRGSVSVTLKSLKQRGLVVEDEQRHLGLSDEGAEIAEAIRVRKRTMMRLFTDVFGVDAKQADIDACKIEHLISAETTDRVKGFLGFCESRDGEALFEAWARFRERAEDPAK